MLYFTDNLSSAPGRLVDADTGFAWEVRVIASVVLS